VFPERDGKNNKFNFFEQETFFAHLGLLLNDENRMESGGGKIQGWVLILVLSWLVGKVEPNGGEGEKRKKQDILFAHRILEGKPPCGPLSFRQSQQQEFWAFQILGEHQTNQKAPNRFWPVCCIFLSKIKFALVRGFH
jgi:hypothetical protein